MIRLIKKYLKGYGRAAVAAPLLKFVEAALELMMPLVVSHMIDSGLGDGSVGTVVWSGVMLVAMSLVGLAFSLGCQYLASKAAVGFGCNMRRALYAHVQRLEPGVIDSVGTGPLLSRLTTDVAQAQQGFAMFLRLMLRAPFIAVGAIVMSIVVAPHLWYISLAAAALVFVALVIVMRVSVPRFNKVQCRLDAESQLTGETVKGERVIRAFDNESRSVDRFVRAADSHRKAATGAAVISCLLNPLASVVVNIAVVMTLWIGAGDVDTGAITQGELVALINYLTQILLALMAISLLMVLVSKALSSAARINEVLDLPECAEGAGALPDPDAPLVEFRNASFSFGGEENAVGGLDLTLRRGEVLGVIGTTGSGKSTMAGMLTRFYRATEGEVRVAGNNVNDYTDEQLCSLVTLAPQKPLLFSGTVRSNLDYGGGTDDDKQRALEDADAAGFVLRKSGLDTIVLQKGSNFSGGEKQRLSLARALLRDAPVLVLDDAASALDYVTESRVMERVLARSRDKAVINISQRAGTVRHADKILVLDGGKVVGLGTHDQLIQSCEVYRRLNNNG